MTGESVNLGSLLKLEQTKNLSDELFLQLRHLIIAGELPPNFVFPNETALCEMLGIGRSSLREAYKALESQGFITRTKRGTYVNSQQAVAAAVPLSVAMEMSDFQDLLEFRAMFEAELAGLAAERATADNVEALRTYLGEMKHHRTDLKKLTHFDTLFHLEVAAASKNHLFINTMGMASDTFFKGVYNAFQVDTEANVTQAISYHEALLLAIERGDVAMARNTMRSHVQTVRGYTLHE